MPDYFNHHSITNHRHSGPKWLVAIMAWLAATVVPILAQGPQLSLVAMAGTHIAGLEENEILRGWGFAKGINRRGEVIFTGGISKRDSDGNSTQAGFGIWCGKPGEIRLLARDGQALPGDDTALIFSELLPPLAFNNQGEVAFLARIGPDLRTHDATALFIGTPGKLRMVARDGDAAPGFENANGRLEFKTVFKRSDQTRLALSDTGALAWTAGVVQAENTIDFGVWLTKNGETELITPPLEGVITGQFVALGAGSDGSLTFYESDASSTLYFWKDSELTQLARVSQKIGESNTRWTRLGTGFHQSDNSIVFYARTRLSGATKDGQSIWHWKEGNLRQIAMSDTTLVPDQLVSESLRLHPIPGISLVAYEACGKHPVTPDRFCENVLLATDGTDSRVIAYEGMPFSSKPAGSEIVLDGVPGLIDKRIVANNRGSIVVHLGEKTAEGQILQGLYRVSDEEYSPIIEQGDIVKLGSAGQATSIRFHLFANTSEDAPFRSLNDNNQLLFSISSEEHQDALVVASIGHTPTPSIKTMAEGISLQWDGNGTLESATHVIGPWGEASSQALNQAISKDSPSQFFRIRL